MSETKVRVHQPARSSQWADSSDAELDRTVPNESASANHGHPEHESLEVRAGFAVRKHKLVKSGGLDDLVLQGVQNGHAMNDQNILKRHLQPAARKLGLPFVNWRCLRTSHATWLIQAGADVKSVQGQMRHSRSSTTLDIYAQTISSSQRRALQQLTAFAGGGAILPAAQQTAMDLDFDFSSSGAGSGARSNSRSKTVQ